MKRVKELRREIAKEVFKYNANYVVWKNRVFNNCFYIFESDTNLIIEGRRVYAIGVEDGEEFCKSGSIPYSYILRVIFYDDYGRDILGFNENSTEIILETYYEIAYKILMEDIEKKKARGVYDIPFFDRNISITEDWMLSGVKDVNSYTNYRNIHDYQRMIVGLALVRNEESINKDSFEDVFKVKTGSIYLLYDIKGVSFTRISKRWLFNGFNLDHENTNNIILDEDCLAVYYKFYNEYLLDTIQGYINDTKRVKYRDEIDATIKQAQEGREDIGIGVGLSKIVNLQYAKQEVDYVTINKEDGEWRVRYRCGDKLLMNKPLREFGIADMINLNITLKVQRYYNEGYICDDEHTISLEEFF